MFRIVKSFKTKNDVFPSNMYLYGPDNEFICEIKDTTLFDNEFLLNARYINQFMDSFEYNEEK